MRDLRRPEEATRSLHSNLVLAAQVYDASIRQLNELSGIAQVEVLPRLLMEAVARLVVRAQRRMRLRMHWLRTLVEEELISAGSMRHPREGGAV